MAKRFMIGACVNALVMGWLLVLRVVPAERSNMTVFWVFVFFAVLGAAAYAITAFQPTKPPDYPTVPGLEA